jgi:hypothetical protein
MGSPYFVHQQVNRIHVVRSARGLERVLAIVAKSMGLSDWRTLKEGPEQVVIHDLLRANDIALYSESRSCVFLEARYEWTGWEKFQRVIVFDYSSAVRAGETKNLAC